MNRRRVIFSFLLLSVVAASVVACGNYELEVQNKSDEILDIYIDDYYEGSVAPKNYLLVRRLSYGDHYVEAVTIDDELMMDDDIFIDGDSKLVIHDSYFRFYR